MFHALHCCVIPKERGRKTAFLVSHSMAAVHWWWIDSWVRLSGGLKLRMKWCDSPRTAGMTKTEMMYCHCRCVFVTPLSSSGVFQGVCCRGTHVTAWPCASNLANAVEFLIGISVWSGRIDHCGSPMPLIKRLRQGQYKLWENNVQSKSPFPARYPCQSCPSAIPDAPLWTYIPTWHIELPFWFISDRAHWTHSFNSYDFVSSLISCQLWGWQ